jgi:hypothetical protein
MLWKRRLALCSDASAENPGKFGIDIFPLLAVLVRNIEVGLCARPDETAQAKTGRRTAELPAVCAWRTTEQVRQANAESAETCRASQSRTANEINSSAPLT